MIKVLLWDIDGTLLNFLEAEKAAIRACFEKYELGVCTDEMLTRYSDINRSYWERLERKELTKPEVLVGRFRDFFAEYGLRTECAEAFNGEYQVRLGDTICFNDDGYEVVRSLKGRVLQYAVTNGTYVAQNRKLALSGLGELFDGVFISDLIGHEKPDIRFFEAVWAQIGAYAPEEVMIVGDSLTSDMQGGNHAGIRCCWYNPTGAANTKGVRIDHEIRHLSELAKHL